MPQDGQLRVGVASRSIRMIPEYRHCSGFRVLVPHRDEGYPQADQLPESGAPEPGTRDHDVSLEGALGGADTGHHITALVDLAHLLAPEERCAAVDFPPPSQPSRGWRAGTPTSGCLQAPTH